MTRAQKLRSYGILQANAKKAIKIAARKAIIRHQQAGVPAVVLKNGKVVQVTEKSVRLKSR